MKTLFIKDHSVFFINGKPTFVNGPRILPRNPPDCIILVSCVFDNFSLANELFSKVLPKPETQLILNYVEN